MNSEIARLVTTIAASALGIVSLYIGLHLIKQFRSERRRERLEDLKFRWEEREHELRLQKEELIAKRLQAEIHKAELEIRRVEFRFSQDKQVGDLSKFRAEELLRKIAELEHTLLEREQELRRERQPAARKGDQVPVHFTAYCPKTTGLGEWKSLLTYLHVPQALYLVQADSLNQLKDGSARYEQSRAESPLMIKRGTEIVVVPEMQGCRFNPAKSTVAWLEDWHRVGFRFQAFRELPLDNADSIATGRIAFFVGPVLIAELPIHTQLRPATQPESDEPPFEFSGEPYQAIFVPYSHKDKFIVDRLQQAYTALGMMYLRDVDILRSGEEWNVALLRKIEEADIFQLCWSQNAKQSPAVEREWRHALGQSRGHFIRPLYWEVPMPDPPNELQHMHFAHLDW